MEGTRFHTFLFLKLYQVTLYNTKLLRRLRREALRPEGFAFGSCPSFCASSAKWCVQLGSLSTIIGGYFSLRSAGAVGGCCRTAAISLTAAGAGTAAAVVMTGWDFLRWGLSHSVSRIRRHPRTFTLIQRRGCTFIRVSCAYPLNAGEATVYDSQLWF